MKQIRKLVTLALFVGLSFFCHAQDGLLDTSFDNDGKVTTNIVDYDEAAWSVIVQNDGKILTAGRGNIGTGDDIVLVRYNIDGSLDTTFDSDGKVVTGIGTGNDQALSVTIQNDGKIIVAGCSDNGTDNDFALVRYNADGSLDPTFDNDGIVTTPIGQANDCVLSMVLQSDGKIVVAGYGYFNNYSDIALARYNLDGSLDTSFDIDGKLITSINALDDAAWSVALQTDGKIVVSGFSFTTVNNSDFTVLRYNINGSLDTSFGNDGIVITPVGLYNDEGCSVALQNDGKIVVAGFGQNNSYHDFAVVRYNSNGSMDTTFDNDGKVLTPIGPATDDGRDVLIQADGKIVVAGFAYNSATNNDFALVRYNPDGSLDTSFDVDGKVTTPLGSSYDGALAISIQNDGKIVAAGVVTTIGYTDFAVARYTNPSLAIDEVNQKEITIYPNPVSQVLTIQLNETIRFQKAILYNTLGQFIKTEYKNEINVSDLAHGSYIIEISTDKGKITKNFIVE